MKESYTEKIENEMFILLILSERFSLQKIKTSAMQCNAMH